MDRTVGENIYILIYYILISTIQYVPFLVIEFGWSLKKGASLDNVMFFRLDNMPPVPQGTIKMVPAEIF